MTEVKEGESGGKRGREETGGREGLGYRRGRRLRTGVCVCVSVGGAGL